MASSEDDLASLFSFESSTTEQDNLNNVNMLHTEGLFEDIDTLYQIDCSEPENMATLGETSSPSTDEESDQERVSSKFIARLSDEKLENMPMRALNKHLRRLPDGLIQKVRKRRRILKNRKYSQKFRQKGCERKNNIVSENKTLEVEILQAKKELRKVRQERDDFKHKYAQLKRTVAIFGKRRVIEQDAEV